jgi:hypothetical protein
MNELEKEVKLENLSGRVAADLIEKMESGAFSAIKVISEIPSLNVNVTSKEEMEEYFQKVLDLGRELSMVKVDLETFLVLTTEDN